VETIDGLERYSCVALVDTQPEAGNNSLPRGAKVGIVIDHHQPYQASLNAVRFVDVREDVGATVCLVVQYLEAAGIEPDQKLATAIFYGIQTDTRSLTRSDSPIDQRIYFKMLGRIDRDLLMQVEQARLPREYFKAFVRGLQAARVAGHVVVSYLGLMHRPDFAAELADLLIRLKDAQVVLCSGYHDTTMYISMRASDPKLDAGRLIQEIIVPQGRAGGHGLIAGGRVPLEGLKPDDVAFEIERRFLSAMGENPREADQLL
jgi:nanoRNase/pAp phosphatase (c-di-AMP/oligoRNAs hydrolase)